MQRLLLPATTCSRCRTVPHAVSVLRRWASSHDAISPAEAAEPVRVVKKAKGKGKIGRSLLPKPAPTSGEIVAFATADSYDLETLQKVLQGRGLIHLGHPSDALNLLGEAVYLPRWQDGEAFIFENGTFVTWNVQKDGIAQLLSQIIQAPGVSPKAYAKPQEETLPYAFDENAPSKITGDLVILGSFSSDSLPPAIQTGLTHLPPPGRSAPVTPVILPPAHAPGLTMTPTAILDRFAFSSGLVRSCKLAVYEELLDDHLEEVSVIPLNLQTNGEMKLSRHEIVARFGYLLNIRQQLNLTESNLLDPPELLWETGDATEKLYERMCRTLDLQERLDILNKKLDYAENLQETLMELENSTKSHRLEWIIIWLIAIEIALTLYREGLPFVPKEQHEWQTDLAEIKVALQGRAKTALQQQPTLSAT